MKSPIRICLPAILCILIAVAESGCRKPAETVSPPPSTPAAAPAWPAMRPTDRGSFKVTIQPDGGRITTHEHFSLEVVVEPGAGVGTPNSVSVDADMPSHGHGMNTQPETTPEGGNRYRTRGMLFHMAGEWSIMVDITVGRTRERAFFPLTVE